MFSHNYLYYKNNLLIIISVISVNFILIFLPLLNKLNLIKIQQDRILVKINLLKNLKISLPNDKLNHKHNKNIKAYLFTSESLHWQIIIMQRLINESKMKLLSLNHLTPMAQKHFKIIPIQITLKGSFENFLDFFEKLLQIRKLIAINTIKLNKTNNQQLFVIYLMIYLYVT